MSDKKISQLTNLTGANLADNDEFVLVDTSADETKAITWSELKEGLDTGTGFVRITGDTMTGDLTVPNLITSGNVDGRDVSADGTKLDGIETNADVTDTTNVTAALNGGTLSSLTITSADINGGTIDGTVIGGSTAAAGSFTTLSASTSITGTLATAAQTNITSVGSLTSLDVTGTVTADGLTVDGDVALNDQSVTIGATANSYNELRLFDSVNTAGTIRIRSNAGVLEAYNSNAKRMSIASNGDISFYEDTGTTPKFFWDASAESLGIGTSSPSGLLELKSTTNNAYLYITADNASSSRVYLGDEDSATIGRIGYNHGFNFMDFYVNGSERMRIDSSGNLLVGTTNASPATNNVDGAVLRSQGHINVSRSGGVVGYFNRRTSDGTILDLRKDGSTVGSIGVEGGNNLYIGSSQTNHAGLNFTANAISPMLEGSLTDATVALGTGSRRYTDLYLSGGVYLGGTGSANKLDDYEYGTFTPTQPTVGFSSATGTYEKIGRLVIARFKVTYNSNSSGVSAFIRGFPFSKGGAARNNGEGALVAYTNYGSSDIFLFGSSTSAEITPHSYSSHVGLTCAAFSGLELQGTYFYYVDA